MDLQKKYFIELAESCRRLLKIALWDKLGCVVQIYRIAFLKMFFSKHVVKHVFETHYDQ